MKKLNYLIISLLLISNAAFSQIDTVSIKSLSLKGKIKKVTDFSFAVEENPKGDFSLNGKKYVKIPLTEDWNLEKDQTKFSKTNIAYIFDAKGQNTEIITYLRENKVFGGLKFSFDNDGKVLKSQSIFTADDGNFIADKTYFYNEKKQLVKIDEFEGSNWILTMTFKYDDLGNCIEKNKVASQSILEKDIQNYQEKNLVLEKKIRAEYIKEKRFAYNQANKVISSEESFVDRNVFLKVENEYDKNNNLIKSVYVNEDKQETVCRYKYAKGKLSQVIYTATDDPSFYLETNYSYQGNKETEISKTKTEEVSKKIFENGLLIYHKTANFEYSYKYSFNKKGHWEQVIMLENGAPSKVRTRKIDYF